LEEIIHRKKPINTLTNIIYVTESRQAVLIKAHWITAAEGEQQSNSTRSRTGE